MKKNVTIVCDMQFGSCGKGACIGYLATRDKPDTVVTSWMPNAGHQHIDASGRKFVHCSLANGVVSPNLKRIMIAPGSVLDLDRLRRELTECQDLVFGKQLIIHQNAAVVNQSHRDLEGRTMDGIGSTKKGCGAAIVQKIQRQVGDEITVGTLPTPPDLPFVNVEIVDTAGWIDHLNQSDSILVEGAQGFSLGINSGFYPYCLSYDTKVLMADGSMQKVGDLVAKKDTSEVMCLDDSGAMVARPTTNWFKHDNPSGKFYMIRTATSEFAPQDRMWYGAKMTGDHEVKTLRGTKRVDELKPGDRIYTTEKKLYGDALQVFLGSMLGDGAVCDVKKSPARASYSESHSEAQKTYLTKKAVLLLPHIGGRVRTITNSATSFKPGTLAYRYESSYSAEVREWATSLGCFGKKNPDIEAIFDLMGWKGLAIWFQDDGRYKKSSNGDEVIFYTNGFTEDEVNRICKCLGDKFGLVATLNWHKNPDGKKYPTTRLSRSSHALFFDNIRRYISVDLAYKIPVGYSTSWDFVGDEPLCTTEVITSIEQVDGLNRRGARSGKYSYCIEVDEHHNFFVGNGKGRINVENCTSRECTPAQIMSDTLISPKRVTRVIGVMRTYPIRVANRYDADGNQIGYSGPGYFDQNETTWDEVGQEPEITTVTKLQRRVFTFSWEQTRQAMSICSPDEIYLSFCDYLDDGGELLRDRINVLGEIILGNRDVVKFMAHGPAIGDVVEVSTRRPSTALNLNWRNG